MTMYQPGISDVHVNVPLSNLSIGFSNAEYIGLRVAPTVFVGKQTDIYVKYDKSHWFRDEVQQRAPGARAEESGWSYDTTSTYYAKSYALAKSIPDELRRNADEWANLDADATMFLTDKAQMKYETVFATYFATGQWTTDKTGTTDFVKFSDYGASSPIQQLRTYMRTVRQLVQRRPNVFVVGDFGFDILADHPDFIERIKGAASPGSPAIVTPQLLASVLRLDRIEIGSAMKTTTAEGVAEASVTYTDIFDDDGLLLYVTSSPSRMNPSALYTFTWVGGDVPRQPWYMRSWRDDPAGKDVREVRAYFDMRITAADAGLFLSDMVD